MQHTPLIRIGTRASQLALWQANHVRTALEANGYACKLVQITSEGDRVLDKPLPIIGGKGVFTKALDDALLAGEIDLAVHSLKDVPTAPVPGLELCAVLPREDVRDALVLPTGRPSALAQAPPAQAIVGTGSLRRRAQWLHRHPGHDTHDLRGNVQTRLQRLEDTPAWQGIILAAAGLIRLGLQARIHHYLEWMLPAPAQGAIGVVCRTGHAPIQVACAPLHHSPTALACLAERTVLARLGGGCSAPLGTLAQPMPEMPGHLRLQACLHSLDGHTALRTTVTAPVASPAQAEHLGQLAVDELVAQGAPALLEQVKLAGPKLY